LAIDAKSQAREVIAKGCMFEALMDQNFQRLGVTTPRP